jgi:AraC-like DNA-binding protein
MPSMVWGGAPMFVNHFDFHLPSAGARYRQHELRGRDLMVLRVRAHGAIVDESLDRPRGSRGNEWSRARFVLDGPLHVRKGDGALLGRGHVHASSAFRRESGRSLTRATDWLDLYWRNGSSLGDALSDGVVLRLSSQSFARVQRLAERLTELDAAASLTAASDVLGDLRAYGLPLASPCVHEPPAHTPRFARVLWQLAGELRSQPMAVDLSRALGVSERHALRQASRYFQQFHLSASSWREFIRCLRLEMGAFFMGAPAARTEDVSAFLGFSSPTGFCHAFHDAGLPSPRKLRDELRCG